MNNIVVFPTFQCGLSCPYCRYQQQKDNKSIKYLGSNYFYNVEKELEPEKWIKLLHSFAPASYDFSGGEPLRYSGIVPVLNSLPKWSITSNTLYYTKDIDLSRCAWWTASYHPHADEKAKKLFMDNIDEIRKFGVGVGVTLVAKPETLTNVLIAANEFAAKGFKVNIHPYYDDVNFSWYDHPKEMKILLQVPYLMYDTRLFTFKGIIGKGPCRAGENYFAIGPDGKIFRCLTDMLFGRKPIDHRILFNECSEKCYFPCDWVNRKGI